ncbi:hypothetical protein MA16_Dca005786 [Dendrobium catenatum]|uniref:Uncharacterized protein n=1 Tax=Dendrobium catenatum TaxID=906689 RepID=A0A2I0WX74_9ASPA|nr:hypothetical protein MA16_Dca005785 [Dendrobium catenatum]PKU80255.1 hypothetical protein MA16_Dca005786 [Dendrobium catenatum]
MTDKGKEPVVEDNRSLESLWANQANIMRQLEVLSADVQRLSVEVRREFNLNRTRTTPHQHHRAQAPAVSPRARHGMDLGRPGRRNPLPIQEGSESEDEVH